MDEDRNFLPQINLAMIFGESSRLSIHYRKLPGNIADVWCGSWIGAFAANPISMSHTADATDFSSTGIIETETSFRRNL